MRLNLLEFLVMTNPVRGMIHRYFEARQLERIAGTKRRCGKTLEIGCGSGIGAAIILDRFQADRVDAFDFDLRMVKMAKRRLSGAAGAGGIWNGDATHIAAADAAYDSVFDFGAIHHIVDWRRSLAEVHRVLKPGGVFYVQEVFRELIAHPVWKRVLDHPQEDRFDFHQFAAALTAAGFVMIGTRRLGQGMGWFVCQKR